MWVSGIRLRLFRPVQLAFFPTEASRWLWIMVFTQSVSLCLLIGDLWPFALKVIFEKDLMLFMVMFVVLVGWSLGNSSTSVSVGCSLVCYVGHD